MVPSLEELLPAIRKLTPNRPLIPSELLVEEFRIFKDGKIEAFFMPTGQINQAAKMLLVGITPGWTQMELAYRHLRQGLERGLTPEAACHAAKYASCFGGAMRVNLVKMMDELDIPNHLAIPTSETLFAEHTDKMQPTSVLRHPVFVAGKNFTGHHSGVANSDFARFCLQSIFIPEANAVSTALIIPMGDFVSSVLSELCASGQIDEDRCLFGFPHPSGANGHRKQRFQEVRDELARKADCWFSYL